MSGPQSKENLIDDEKLCEHCFCDEDLIKFMISNMNACQISAHSSGCEGAHCEDAYEYYLDNFEEENEKMDNLEKAKKANELAIEITNHKNSIRYLNKELNSLSQNARKSQVRLDGSNFDATIDADEDLIKFMISKEINRSNILEEELELLLNGDINKIKAMLNKGGEE